MVFLLCSFLRKKLVSFKFGCWHVGMLARGGKGMYFVCPPRLPQGSELRGTLPYLHYLRRVYYHCHKKWIDPCSFLVCQECFAACLFVFLFLFAEFERDIARIGRVVSSGQKYAGLPQRTGGRVHCAKIRTGGNFSLSWQGCAATRFVFSEFFFPLYADRSDLAVVGSFRWIPQPQLLITFLEEASFAF